MRELDFDDLGRRAGGNGQRNSVAVQMLHKSNGPWKWPSVLPSTHPPATQNHYSNKSRNNNGNIAMNMK